MTTRGTNWSEVRVDYESGQFSQSALERKYNVSRQAIKKRAAKEGWKQPEVTGAKLHGVSSQRVKTPPTRDAAAGIRVADALKLRAQKLTYAEIAEEVGYSDPASCRRAIQRE